MRQADLHEFRMLCGNPQRIAWAVAQANGQRSICPLGWMMDTSMSPWMMAIAVAPKRFTHGLIAVSGEFVIAWPGADLAQATLQCGTTTGSEVDKFAAAGLTALTGTHVQTPLVAECIANLECRLVGQLDTGDHTIFAGEILAVWVNAQPQPQLCMVGSAAGYDVLLEHEFYRFGVVKR